MVDMLSKKQRSYCMSRIRPSDTKPEIKLRKCLWHLGVRYRVKNNMPGRPDIIFVGARIAVFVDGCFWHRCPKHYVPPKTRAKFWEEKISKNVARDRRNSVILEGLGWKVIRFWEHEINGSLDDCVGLIVKALNERKVKD